MKKNHVIMLSAFAALAMLSSCGNDVVTDGDNTKKTETSEETTGKVIFTGGGDASTRTSISNYTAGGSATVKWSTGDYIWVKDTDGNFQKSDVGSFNTAMTYGQFALTGTFSNSCQVNYTGSAGTSGTEVTIATAQTQTTPNDFSHVGESGDCGTATTSGTKFMLEHKAVYLNVMPRCTNSTLGQNIYLTKVVVTSADTDIAGTFDFTSGSIGAATSGAQSITLTTKGSGYYTGFPLTNTTTSQSTNAAYMVIAPGTHTLTVDCYIRDPTTNVEGAISQTLPSTNFEAGKIYDVTANCTPTDYSINSYYMWDAVNPYWDNITLPDVLTNNTNYSSYGAPVAFDGTDRWYNTVYSGSGVVANASNSCTIAPNANELYYYLNHGDPHWDDNTLWSFRGHLYNKGLWLKKQAVIFSDLQTAGYTQLTSQSDMKEKFYSSVSDVTGTDYRTTYRYTSSFTLSNATLTSTSDYFYLPALGYFSAGILFYVGGVGTYWLSNGSPSSSGAGYNMMFSPGGASVSSNSRNTGFVVRAFE